MSATRVLPAVLALLVLGIFITGCTVLEPDTVGAGTEGNAEDAACKEDWFCWSEKHLPNAEALCKSMIEERAPFGHRWVMRGEPRIFTSRIGISEGVISYWGNMVWFQNGMGKHLRMSYDCQYKPGPYPDSGYVERLIVEPR